MPNVRRHLRLDVPRAARPARGDSTTSRVEIARLADYNAKGAVEGGGGGAAAAAAAVALPRFVDVPLRASSERRTLRQAMLLHVSLSLSLCVCVSLSLSLSLPLALVLLAK